MRLSCFLYKSPGPDRSEELPPFSSSSMEHLGEPGALLGDGDTSRRRRSQSGEKTDTQVCDFNIMEVKAASLSPTQCLTSPIILTHPVALGPSLPPLSYAVSPIPVASSQSEWLSSLEKEKKKKKLHVMLHVPPTTQIHL